MIFAGYLQPVLNGVKFFTMKLYITLLFFLLLSSCSKEEELDTSTNYSDYQLQLLAKAKKDGFDHNASIKYMLDQIDIAVASDEEMRFAITEYYVSHAESQEVAQLHIDTRCDCRSNIPFDEWIQNNSDFFSKEDIRVVEEIERLIASDNSDMRNSSFDVLADSYLLNVGDDATLRTLGMIYIAKYSSDLWDEFSNDSQNQYYEILNSSNESGEKICILCNPVVRRDVQSYVDCLTNGGFGESSGDTASQVCSEEGAYQSARM